MSYPSFYVCSEKQQCYSVVLFAIVLCIITKVGKEKEDSRNTESPCKRVYSSTSVMYSCL